jgi:release factor glutamine methyltransferase
MAELKSVRELINVTAEWFDSKGVDSSRVCAERLLGDCINLSRLELYLHSDRLISTEELNGFRDLVRRRGAGEPLQHLLGETEFYSKPFKVLPNVLIPRPETELLVEQCIKCLTFKDSSILNPKMIELGVGSGIISVSVACEIPRLEVHSTDISEDAINLSTINTQLNGVSDKVNLYQGNLFEPLPSRLIGKVDLLVSNPPYIESKEIANLQLEVAEYDPRLALDGGADGLDFYRRIASEADKWLTENGKVVLEIGSNQGEDVSKIFNDAGFGNTFVTKDYNNLDRVVVAYITKGES